jgi:hypothetical protein
MRCGPHAAWCGAQDSGQRRCQFPGTRPNSQPRLSPPKRSRRQALNSSTASAACGAPLFLSTCGLWCCSARSLGYARLRCAACGSSTSISCAASSLRRCSGRGEPLKTEMSRSAVPIPSELALELAANVKRWPGATVVTDGNGGPASPWAIERAGQRGARSTGCPRASDSTIFGTTSRRCQSRRAPTSRSFRLGFGTPRPRPPSTPTGTCCRTAMSPHGRPSAWCWLLVRTHCGLGRSPLAKPAGQRLAGPRCRSRARTHAGAGGAGSRRSRSCACTRSRCRSGQV